MTWYQNLGNMITTLAANPATAAQAGTLLSNLTTNNRTNATIVALLQQVTANPSEAGAIAAQITALPNVPPAVMGLVSALPAAASDKVQLAVLEAQIQAALPTSSFL